MSTYGVELISETGHKFVIPDSNPYTFHERYRLEVNNNRAEVNTGVPTSAKTMMFNRIAGGELLNYLSRSIEIFARNGTWWISAYSAYHTIYHVYFFTDREYKDVNGSGYGVQIFDAEGNQIIGCNSRPLKMRIEPIRPDGGFVVPLGYPAACTPSIIWTDKWNWDLFLDYGSAISVIGEDDGYSGMAKEIGSNEHRIQYVSKNYPQYFLAIDSREYD